MCALPIYGRTAGVPERPLSIERYADDVVGLLKFLGIAKADFFGESYGVNAAAMIAVRHPELVRRVALYGATFGPSQDALNPEMRSEEHTSELQSLMRISYAVFCLKKKKEQKTKQD